MNGMCFNNASQQYGSQIYLSRYKVKALIQESLAYTTSLEILYKSRNIDLGYVNTLIIDLEVILRVNETPGF